MPLVAGIDSSTQSVKVLVVDADDGRVVASGRAPHDVEGTGGARETHPDVWWEALASAVADTGRGRDVAALAVGGQQHGLVARDAAGEVVRPAPLWNDTRSAPDARDLIDDLGGAGVWAERIGVVPVASFTATKWAWLRRMEPDAARRTATVGLPHDDLTRRLTGEHVTDRGDASGTAWWSTDTESYAHAVLDLDRIALSPDALPRVLGPQDAAGEVVDAAADALGLRSGAVVGPGTGDNMAAALGLGLGPGRAAVSLGTSGTVYAVSERRTVDETGTVAGFADATGRFLPLAATLNATQAVDRVADWLGLDRDDLGGATGDSRVVVLPFLDGERTPDLPRAAGTVVGLRHDTTAAEILRATYEGAVVSLVEALDRVERLAGGGAGPLVVVGGGARGATWIETLSRLTGRELVVPEADEAVALGAAVQAAACLTGDAPLDVATAWGHGGGERTPARPVDEQALALHRSVRDAAAGLHDAGW